MWGIVIKNIATIDKNIIFATVVYHADFAALSGFPAPKFCPTKVAAALLIPHDGNMVKIITLMATVYPATAESP